ncbi:histidine kinase group protein [Ophiostoma piceae UAMH 11346]|uniref:Histidine kinase group protein n=1 Tax=Ophiostoma piceae (strain UAMH 11346) TaxID=1262450 RepID=S3C1Y2_OPHP1|nr:histidine kinase group protein [Ophiostoma piceae UAMH 11346]
MDLPQPSASAKGKCRALPLNLQDIAAAIHNLPTDSSALLPTPALSAQFAGFSEASGAMPRVVSSSSSNDDCIATDHDPTTETQKATLAPSLCPSDDVYKRAIGHVMQRTKRQMELKLAYGYTTLEKIEASVSQRQMSYGLDTRRYKPGPGVNQPSTDPQKSAAERLEDALNMLKEEVLNTAGNIALDDTSIQVLTQGLVPRRNGDGSMSQPPYTPCTPGTVLSWTKYFKGIGSSSNSRFVLHSQPSQQAYPGTPIQARSQAVQAHVGQKRRLQEDAVSLPVEKKRIISLEVSERECDAFQTQHLLSGNNISSKPTAYAYEERKSVFRPSDIKFDLISSICSCLDLIFQVCQYLSLKDISALYCTSRVFKGTFDSNLKSNVLYLARKFSSPETISIFPWVLYKKAAVKLPGAFKRPGTDDPSSVYAPTLRYVNMLVSRQRKVRDIIACLARAGHRLPRESAPAALKKMWLLMDIPTNRGRAAFMQNEEVFTDEDLLVMQMFRVKLEMHFSNPLRGPFGAAGATTTNAGDEQKKRLPCSLVETLLGQRSGLHVLWIMLRGKGFRGTQEVIELKVRYDYVPSTLLYPNGEDQHLDTPNSSVQEATSSSSVLDFNDDFERDFGSNHLPSDNWFDLDLSPEQEETLNRIAKEHNEKLRQRALENAIHEVPVWEMGVGHLEGWGLGTQHLLRPDELVTLEASRRRRNCPEDPFELDRHVHFMPVWGARDFETGGNLVPSIDEMYMSDSEDDDLARSPSANEESCLLDVHDISSVEKARIAAIVASDDCDVFESAETRLSKGCGNVPLKHSDWQPWQVLKDRWDTLPQQEKLDVWWMNLQERLRRQGWSHRSTIDDNRGNQVSYEEAVEDAAVEEHGLESGESNGDEIPFPVPGNTMFSPSQHMDNESAAPNLSARHQSIVQSSIAWALQEQDEVDAALVAQSDMPYEEEELQHWDQFLNTVGPVLANVNEDGNGGGSLASDEMDDNDDDMGTGPWDSEEANASSFEESGGHEEDNTGDDSTNPEPPAPQPPSPQAVLVPEYGCPKEVLRLARQTHNAEVALQEAETASGITVSSNKRAELAASATHLRRNLDAVIRGEVFAIEL